ncbi:hypothetical protein ABWED_2623 [Acinetobacter lwoffii]|nr:hypothetical protein ABWED_2623 [Acinetobacter lwoffii]
MTIKFFLNKIFKTMACIFLNKNKYLKTYFAILLKNYSHYFLIKIKYSY